MSSLLEMKSQRKMEIKAKIKRKARRKATRKAEIRSQIPQSPKNRRAMARKQMTLNLRKMESRIKLQSLRPTREMLSLRRRRVETNKQKIPRKAILSQQIPLSLRRKKVMESQQMLLRK